MAKSKVEDRWDNADGTPLTKDQKRSIIAHENERTIKYIKKEVKRLGDRIEKVLDTLIDMEDILCD